MTTMTEPTPATLIAEILQLRNWMNAQTEKFHEFLKPHAEQIETLTAKLHAHLLTLNEAKEGENPKASIATGSGTAYLSTTTSYSIDGDHANFLDWCLDDWDARGAMLKIGAPYVDPVRAYMDGNQGQLPPHLKSSSITRCNVTKGK